MPEEMRGAFRSNQSTDSGALDFSLKDYTFKESVEREATFFWMISITVTGFEVEGLNLDGKAYWSAEASEWQINEPVMVKTSRITL